MKTWREIDYSYCFANYDMFFALPAAHVVSLIPVILRWMLDHHDVSEIVETVLSQFGFTARVGDAFSPAGRSSFAIQVAFNETKDVWQSNRRMLVATLEQRHVEFLYGQNEPMRSIACRIQHPAARKRLLRWANAQRNARA